MKVLAGVVLTALAFVVASNAGGAVTTNTIVPSSFTFFDPCAGEDVAVSGDVHVLATSTVTGNTVSGVFHSNFKATGVGAVSGLTYQEQVVANTSFQTSLQNGEATHTFVGRITIIAPGSQNNQTSPIFLHTTFDADGNLTSTRIEAPTVTCQ